MPNQIENRVVLAAAHLSGAGIEIGACQVPVSLPPGVSVKYVDLMPREELISRFTYLSAEEKDLVVGVDVVDDGEVLSKIADTSLDFIIANHFIEHCANPIGTIITHLRKIKDGGALYYAVPDKNFTFDKTRSNTPLDHLINEFVGRSDPFSRDHYVDWCEHVDGLTDFQEVMTRSTQMQSEKVRIHFHVWEAHTFVELLSYIQFVGRDFVIERFFPNNGNEFVVILRKTLEPVLQLGGPSKGFLRKAICKTERKLLRLRRYVPFANTFSRSHRSPCMRRY